VYLPGSAAWKEEFVAECVQFTGDEKQDVRDDQVDCLAYAVQQVDRIGVFEAPRPIPNPPRRPLPGWPGWSARSDHACPRQLFGIR
jgi:hypothetical protein